MIRPNVPMAISYIIQTDTLWLDYKKYLYFDYIDLSLLNDAKCKVLIFIFIINKYSLLGRKKNTT